MTTFRRRPHAAGLMLLLAGLCLPTAPAQAQAPVPSAPTPSDHVLITVIFKQDQSRSVGELLDHMRRNGFLSRFPPAGIEPHSWLNVMGLGQVATFRVPPARLREFNVAIESTAWGPYRTEVYAAYDFMQAARELHAEAFARPTPATPTGDRR